MQPLTEQQTQRVWSRVMNAQAVPAAQMNEQTGSGSAAADSLTPEKLLELIRDERADSALYAHLASRMKGRAQAMLRALSGREHRVWSGVCIREGEKVLAESECTSVHFRALTDEEIHAYIATGEPLDKAGAYGYQGLASRFVERSEGDFFNVIGLPGCRMGQMLREFDISLL